MCVKTCKFFVSVSVLGGGGGGGGGEGGSGSSVAGGGMSVSFGSSGGGGGGSFQTSVGAVGSSEAPCTALRRTSCVEAVRVVGVRAARSPADSFGFLVLRRRSPFRALPAAWLVWTMGGAEGLTSLLRFFPNFFLVPNVVAEDAVVVVVVVTWVEAAADGAGGSDVARRCILAEPGAALEEADGEPGTQSSRPLGRPTLTHAPRLLDTHTSTDRPFPRRRGDARRLRDHTERPGMTASGEQNEGPSVA